MTITERIDEIEKQLERASSVPLGLTKEYQDIAFLLSHLKKCMAESPKINGDTSDGYHTFNELYDHRCLLWINLCLLQHPKITYLVENHFDGWFLLGVETPGGQLSYHVPNKYLGLCSKIERRHPEFDGHTSADVLKRLENIAKQALNPQEDSK